MDTPPLKYTCAEFTSTFGLNANLTYVVKTLLPSFEGTLLQWHTECLKREIYDESQTPNSITELIKKKEK